MILVFGKTGQVAKELVLNKGVIALGREQVDLEHPLKCAEAIIKLKPSAVINAAAYTSVDKAENDKDLSNKINGDAPGAMALACAKLGIPIVHISTDYVFDGTGATPWSPDNLPNPINAYGRSKLKGENAIVETGCIYAILRTSWVVSAHGNNFVKSMLRLSQTRENLAVVDDQIGGPTCARDIAKSCLSIAKQLIEAPSKSGVYHYSGTPNVSWCQFSNAIFKKLGSQTVANPILSEEYPTPAMRPLNSRLNCKSTQDIFGIVQPSWQDGVKDILLELEHGYEKS